MNALIPQKLQSLKPYDPEIVAGGIHLDANESFLELPESLKQEIAASAAAISYNRYPDPLAAAACEAFGRRYGVPAGCVTAGNGSDELITILLNCFTQKGDRVLITQPDFSMYQIYCSLAEVEPVVIGKRGDLSFDPDELIEKARSERVRMILFSNPCNPTGQGIDRQAALKIARGAGCITVIDEAYMDFWDQALVSEAPELENLIVLKTMSKIGFAAARLGFAVANEGLTALIRAAKSPYNVNAMTQAAGKAFLDSGEFLDYAVGCIQSSRDSLYGGLKELEARFPDDMKVFRTHTNFVTVAVKKAGMIYRRMKERGLSVRLVADRYFRVTAGKPDENEAFLQEFEKELGEV